MYASWMRALRPVVLPRLRGRIATHRARQFYASAQSRTPAPPAAPTDGNAGDKPDKPDHVDKDDKEKTANPNEGDGKEDAGDGDDRLFGELGTNVDPENHVSRRQRRLNASSRSRATRTRTPEELPPVYLPEDFHETHIYRHDQVPSHFERRGPWREIDNGFESPKFRDFLMLSKERLREGSFSLTDWMPVDAEKPSRREENRDRLSRVLDFALWNQATLLKAHEAMATGDFDTVSRRGDFVVAVAWLLVSRAGRVLGKHESSPEWHRQGSDKYLINSVLPEAMYFLKMLHDGAGEAKIGETCRALQYILHSRNARMPFSKLGLLHHDLLHEALACIASELQLQAPKSAKTSQLRRPILIIDVPYYRGLEWPRGILEEIACDLKADVLHLTVKDIANVVGSYLGQDRTRVPSAISLLGYKAAENAGMIRPQFNSDEDEYVEDERAPYSIIIGERPRRDKKTSTLIESLVGHGSRDRGTPDEMWDDLKINAALEELLRSTDIESPERRPLIVHLHDYVALNMESTIGVGLITKIRKTVDSMWIEGRPVVLVGTCSSHDAPKAYLSALKSIEAPDQVICLHGETGQELPEPLLAFQRLEYVTENTANIKEMLETLLVPGHGHAQIHMHFSLAEMACYHDLDSERFQEDTSMTFHHSILPLSEVQRIARTMIGRARGPPYSFDQQALEEAVLQIHGVDIARERFVESRTSTGSGTKSSSAGATVANTRQFDPRQENHEEKLMSGLVNAENIKTTFADVHAPLETIESIKMLTQMSLIRPEAFSYGVLATDRIPGCLLYGPPGTGKTLLAKAVAKESGANMLEVSGASINNMYVGESEKNVRALFRLAKKKEPMIIFIDEADALLGARGQRDHPARRETLNQFLREWDGMDSMKAFIMVATNRPFDLDEAVLRRLPRRLLIDLPLEQDRAAILRIHLKDEMRDETVSIEGLATNTPLYSGSDLKNVCVAAAMAAVKEELEASAQHTGPEPYVWAAKRILSKRHFDKALKEISASVNEDMQTLTAIKKFDQKYGDGSAKKKRRGMGFAVAAPSADADEARVRTTKR